MKILFHCWGAKYQLVKKLYETSRFLVILPFFLINNSINVQSKDDLHALIGSALVNYTNTINQRHVQEMAKPAHFNNTHAVRIKYDSVKKNYDVYVQQFYLRSEIDTLDYDLVYFNGHFFYLIKEDIDNHRLLDEYYFIEDEKIPAINSVIFNDEMIAHYGRGRSYIVCIYDYRITYKNFKVDLMRIAPANQLPQDFWPVKNLNSYYLEAVTDKLTIRKPKNDRKEKRADARVLKRELKDINVWQTVTNLVY